MTSLPSPGSHWNVSSPAPSRAVSLPCWPSAKSLPSPPSRMSAPLLPSSVSLPEPPSTVMAISASQVAGRGVLVFAAVGVEDELLRRPDVDRERRRVDAVEADPRAVGRGGELLGAVAAVDLDRVGAAGALVEVGVVTRVPDHAVVAGLPEGLIVGVAAGQRVVLAAAEQQVEAALAEQRVVAGLAEQLVAAGAAGEDVVGGAAEQVGHGQRAVGLAQRDHVLAAEAEDVDPRRVGDRRRAPGDGDRTAVDENLARRVATDGDVVVEAVAVDGQHAVDEGRGHGRARRDGRAGDHSDREQGAGEQALCRASPAVVTAWIHRDSFSGEVVLDWDASVSRTPPASHLFRSGGTHNGPPGGGPLWVGGRGFACQAS